MIDKLKGLTMPMDLRLQIMTDKGRLLTDDTVKSHTVVVFASGKGHALISARDSPYDFIVKFSPSMCV